MANSFFVTAKNDPAVTLILLLKMNGIVRQSTQLCLDFAQITSESD